MPRIGGALDIAQVAEPTTPASGRSKLFFKTDGLLYTKSPGGTVTQVGGTSGVTLDTTQTITGAKTFSGGLSLNIPGKNAADAATTYPIGESVMGVGGSQTGWPVVFGIVTTRRYQTSDDGRVFQEFSNDSYRWTRRWNPALTAWSAWVTSMTTDSVQTVTSAKMYTPGSLLMQSADGVSTAAPYSDVNAPAQLRMTTQIANPSTPPAGQAVLWTVNGPGLSIRADDGGIASFNYMGPVFRTYQSTAQAAPVVNTWTPVNFQTEEEDTHSGFASNAFTVPAGWDGVFSLSAVVCVGGGRTAGQNSWVRYSVNGAGIRGRSSGLPAGSDTTDISLHHIRRFVAGDVIRVEMFQRAGVAGLTASNDATSTFEGAWLRP